MQAVAAATGEMATQLATELRGCLRIDRAEVDAAVGGALRESLAPELRGAIGAQV